MWTQAQLTDDLIRIGLTAGRTVLIHASLRSVGKIEGGAATLIASLQEVVGPDGTLIVPAFSYDQRTDPADLATPPRTMEELERARAGVPIFDPATTPSDTSLGALAEVVRVQPDAFRSSHPLLSFAAIGRRAEWITRISPFHYPLGSESPLARLHQLDGYVLLIGVGHAVNTSIHLAEVWADVPYAHRTMRVRTPAGTWELMLGSPECSAGFAKIEPVLRQARILRHGYLGNAPSQLMSQRALVSMAVAMLQGEPSSLLCDDPACTWCVRARKLSGEPTR